MTMSVEQLWSLPETALVGAYAEARRSGPRARNGMCTAMDCRWRIETSRELHTSATHASMIPSSSALDSTPSSAMKTIRARGTPSVGGSPGASVARPPAN